ncbi:sensor histidine kinase [Paenibacillus rhizoplanae]
MSHEIRTPLNGIIGVNQLLAEEISSPEHLELLRLQSTSSYALLHVMSDILDISRLEADGLALNKDSFGLKALLQGCMELFMVSTQDKPLSLKLEIEEGLPDKFTGDAPRIRQILINLIGNAVKFTPSGTVTVKVESYGVRETAQALQFMVRDTGIGISPDKLQLLFQSFSQVDGSHTRKYPGTGLGLAICKKLVDLMQGEIWAEPAEGRHTVLLQNQATITGAFPRGILRPGYGGRGERSCLRQRLPTRELTLYNLKVTILLSRQSRGRKGTLFEQNKKRTMSWLPR